MSTVHLIIHGKVQGVFYRASARKAASQFGITGWARNTREGHVEIMASGPEEQLRNFIDWCKEGPPQAKVDHVVSKPVPVQQFEGFVIMH